MIKKHARIVLGLAVLSVLAITFVVGANRYGWMTPFRSDARVSAEAAPPAHVMGHSNPAFGPECGEYGVDVGGGGYGFNSDLEYHARNSVAIVEGTARVAGPARFGDMKRPPFTGRSQIEVASRITTPFTIKVSKTHKGPEQSQWTVSESGGLVDCVSYRRSAGEVTMFDGIAGLFFISAEPREFEGYWVSMTVAKDGPEWFNFTEQHFGPIDDAVALIKTFK